MNQATQSSTKPSSNSDTLNVIKKNKGKFFKTILDLNATDHNYFYDKNFDGNGLKLLMKSGILTLKFNGFC